MQEFNVYGMSCSACSSAVEKAVNKLNNVESCQVSLLNNSMIVNGNVKQEEVIKAVEKAGYKASLKKFSQKQEQSTNETNDIKILKSRLVYSLIFLALLMYVSMGNMMFNVILPKTLLNNKLAVGILELLLAGIVLVINQKFFISGFKSLINGSPNMDTLVSMGSGISYLYSTFVLLEMTFCQVNGNLEKVISLSHGFYFESSAMILTLITVGKLLEAHSKGKTKDAIKSLMELSPKTATIIKNNQEIVVEVDKVMVGDIFIVKSGESIPVDGVVIEGSGAVNESSLTGESLPVDKTIDSYVSSGTINEYGYLKCKATKVGEDTSLNQIIKMVSKTSIDKAPIAKIADKVSGVFVPTVIMIALITFVIWLFITKDFAYSLERGISVLVISCPCSLGLATPVAIMVGSGIGAKNGLLFKTAEALEQTGKANVIVLDKTGTITIGKPSVTDVISYNITKEELLKIGYSLEQKSEHPLSKAICDYAKKENIKSEEISDFKVLAGNGISGTYNGEEVIIGSAKYIGNQVDLSSEILLQIDDFSIKGKTPLLFLKNGMLIGIVAVMDKIKPDSIEAVKQLKNLGLKVVMLTGDNKNTARAISEEVNIDEVVAEVLPNEKSQEIEKLQKTNKVIMVGDGINDSISLVKADIGIAIGNGTDVAIDSADVVLMKNNLTDIPALIRLSRNTIKNIHQNLFWAFFYNLIGIPLAAGVFIPIFNLKLTPMFGALAMSLSSFCVVTNALRLNGVKIYDSKNDKKNIKKGEYKMEKVVKIEGMMCGHCETRVKKCLEEINGVETCIANHETNTATLTLKKEVSDKVIKKAIEKQGYKVID